MVQLQSFTVQPTLLPHPLQIEEVGEKRKKEKMKKVVCPCGGMKKNEEEKETQGVTMDMDLPKCFLVIIEGRSPYPQPDSIEKRKGKVTLNPHNQI